MIVLIVLDFHIPYYVLPRSFFQSPRQFIIIFEIRKMNSELNCDSSFMSLILYEWECLYLYPYPIHNLILQASERIDFSLYYLRYTPF